MQKIDYNKKMKQIIENLCGKPTLLLHSCCAPCSSACLERIKDFFDITVYFYNPNMDTEEEFNLRKEEQIRLCELLGVNYIIENYCNKDFLSVVKGLEKEKEGGMRCEKCFFLRLTMLFDIKI